MSTIVMPVNHRKASQRSHRQHRAAAAAVAITTSITTPPAPLPLPLPPLHHQQSSEGAEGCGRGAGWNKNSDQGT
jgi:hypothetical protein